MKDKPTRDECMGMGLALGMGVGIAIGLAMDNLAIGPAFGIALGVAFGRVFQKHYGYNPDTWKGLTPGQKRYKSITMLSLGLLALFFLALAFFYN